MNMPDIKIVPTLTLDFKKSFDKGDIDRLYQKMYRLAANLAAEETKRYIIKTHIEDKEQEFGMARKGKRTPHLLSRIPNYTNRRIKFHLEQMYKLLELYAKSKSANAPT